MNDIKNLSLKLTTYDEINYLSALIQDSILIRHSMHQTSKNCFSMLLNRFCWNKLSNEEPERIHSILIFNNVKSIKYNDELIKHDHFKFLNLLAIVTDYNDKISLFFSENKIINLNINQIDIRLKDLDERWPANSVPMHAI